MTREDAIAAVQAEIHRLLEGRRDLSVLEAGCGSAAHLDLPGRRRTVGIDVSARQLARNTGLDERIQGDIQECELPAAEFDVVVCWEVLEHLEQPERAIANLARAVRPGGLLVLAAPNVLSVKGLVTKLTPHWFHVAFYRHVYRVPGAGVDDQAPFPTHLRLSLAPSRLRRLAARHGFGKVAHFVTWDVGPWLRRRNPGAWAVYAAARALSRAATLGSLGDSDFILVLQRDRSAPGQQRFS